MAKGKIIQEMKTTLEAGMEGTKVAKRFDVVLKDTSLNKGVHTVYLDKGYVQFKDGKANVTGATKAKLESMGLI